MVDSVSISSIIDSSYKHAALCRDILRWCTIKFEQKEPLKQFDITEIGNWLLEHHQPFVHEYTDSASHIPKSYRLHSKRTYITDRINELISLELVDIEKRIKSTKNDTKKNVFYFTDEGTFIAWLIEAYSSEGKRRSKAIFNLLGILSIQFFVYDTSSFGEFMLRFLTKHGDSEQIRSTLVDNYEFLVSLFVERNRRKARQLFLAGGSLNNLELLEAFKDTLMEMTEQKRKLLLLEFKLDIESNDYGSIDDWELMRYNNISDYSKVTLLGVCDKCKLYPFLLDIFEFMALPHTFKYRMKGFYDFQRINCKKCGKRNGLSILQTWLSLEGKNYVVYEDPNA
jgi:hypothetical protein